MSASFLVVVMMWRTGSICLGPYVFKGLEGLVTLARSSSSLLLRGGEQNGEAEIVTVDKSGANLAALEALSGQDISAVEKIAFQKVRLSPIYEHCFNDRSWPILLKRSPGCFLAYKLLANPGQG
jgi:hypothetical protein